LKFVDKCGTDPTAMRTKYVPEEDGIRYPFTSKRKRMTT